MKKVWLLLFAILLSSNLISQEFRISVSVNSSQIQGTDKTVFQNIQELLNEFINKTHLHKLNNQILSQSNHKIMLSQKQKMLLLRKSSNSKYNIL